MQKERDIAHICAGVKHIFAREVQRPPPLAIAKWVAILDLLPHVCRASLVNRELTEKFAEVDWRQLCPAGLPRRVALPGYPFARDEYWLDTFAGEDAEVAPGSPVQAAAVPPASTAAGSRDFGLIEDILGRIETAALDAEQGARLLKKLV